jgi:transcription elongation factor GreA
VSAAWPPSGGLSRRPGAWARAIRSGAVGAMREVCRGRIAATHLPHMDADLLITPDGLRNLTSDLASLRSKREALLRVRSRAESAAGGLSSEPLDADELARLEQQIAVLENRRRSAVVVHPDSRDGELDVGELARVRDLDTGELAEYRIVGAGEANPAAGSISYASPVGSALVGRSVGEVVDVEVPSGLLRLEVVEIESDP